MIFRNGELSLLWPFYLYFLIYGLSTMIFPFMIIYFINLGFTFFEVSLITATYAIVIVLLEIPTGIIADKTSRKQAVILGFVITGACILLIPYTQSLIALIILWGCAAIGVALASGAEDSWVIDNLNHKRRKDLSKEYFIKASSITSFGAVFAPFIGALVVVTYPMSILWTIFGIGYLINATILVFAREEYKPLKTTRKPIRRATLIKAIKKRPIVFLILAGVSAQLMIGASVGEQPLLVSLGMAEHQLGYFYSMSALLILFTPFIARRFIDSRIGIIKLLPYQTLAIALIILSQPGMYLYASLLMIIGAVIYTVQNTLHYTLLHETIPTRMRASISSVNSMVIHLSFVLATLITGYLMDLLGPRIIVAGMSVFGVLALALYSRIEPRARVKAVP
jgi:MFS family permease